jgi:pyruvate/2-oxoglutarate dehydrogenase complex dihydrolipoamide dehydrogenase (E3) component
MVVDLIVIGGGAAGLGAARAARARGASVVLVERSRVGGDCTFTGCMPSKAVIEAAGRGDRFDEAMAQARRVIETVAATESASVLRGEGSMSSRASRGSPISARSTLTA